MADKNYVDLNLNFGIAGDIKCTVNFIHVPSENETHDCEGRSEEFEICEVFYCADDGFNDDRSRKYKKIDLSLLLDENACESIIKLIIEEKESHGNNYRD